MLEPLPILFDDEAHRYQWRPTGEWMAYSVTRVTGHKMSAKQRAALDATKHIWEPRGKHVHACQAQFLLGEALLDPGEYADWVDPLLADRFWRDVEPLAVEYAVCDRRRSVGGSLDALVRKQGKTVLLDLKTQSSEKASTYSTHAQLGGYLQMLIDHHKIQIDEVRTIWCRPGKTVIGRSQSPDECLAAWVDAWDLFELDQEWL